MNIIPWNGGETSELTTETHATRRVCNGKLGTNQNNAQTIRTGAQQAAPLQSVRGGSDYFFVCVDALLDENSLVSGIITEPMAPLPVSRRTKRISTAFFSSVTVSEKFNPCLRSCG
jgi:hypothetical protein